MRCVRFGVAAAAAAVALYSTAGIAGAWAPLTLNLVAGSGSSNPYALVESGGALYFVADTAAFGPKGVYRLDPATGAVALMVSDPSWTGGSQPARLFAVAGRVFFEGFSPGSGREPWIAGPDAASSGKLKEIAAGATSSVETADSVALYQGKLYFAATDASTAGKELWVTDGTAAGTVLAADVYAGSFSGQPQFLSVAAGRLFFAAFTGSAGGDQEPHAFDGATATMLADLNGSSNAGVTAFAPINVAAGARALFNAVSGGAPTLYLSDGGVPAAVGAFAPSNLTGGYTPQSLGGKVVFRGNEAAYGHELYVTDGTAGGTGLLVDLRAGTASSNLSGLTLLGDRVCFQADDGVAGREPWCTDGTAAGTVRIGDVNAGSSSSDPLNFSRVGADLFFSAQSGSPRDLYVAPGFGAPQKIVLNGTLGSGPSAVVQAGGKLYVAGSQTGAGVELALLCPGCAIGGACVAEGATNPTNPCEICNSAVTGTAWSPKSGSCNDGDACTQNDACVGGSCGGSPLVCNDGDACTVDSCNAATGCVYSDISATCIDGDACTADSCSPATGCVFTDIGASCSDGQGCTDDGCDPAAGCVFTNNTAPCDDGSACTTGDACAGGSCAGGAALVCNDGDGCTTDSCSPATGCVFTNNTAPCDDGNACTGGDVCNAGSCAAGAPLVCNDGDACTTDSCSPASGCVYTDIGGSCADGDPCTNDGCDPATGCVFTNNTAPCDDGSACTSGDVCNAGSCAGNPLPCSDGNPCTSDGCDPATGCVFTNTTGPCDDGSACTSGDVCNAGGCAGSALLCSDGNPCTSDGCDPATGCVFTNTTAACDDGSACTSGDVCNAGSCAGSPLLCSDGNPCTNDGCDPATGCVFTNQTGPCDDGSACTSGDVCSAGSCAGSPLLCSDGNPCTNDGCDPATGCVFTNQTGLCDDGSACTSGDVCNAGSCAGSPLLCSDGNPCTNDGCDPATGCVFTNQTGPCDDGSACTSGDLCNAGSCAGSPLLCGDGNPCTSDGCDPATGCVFTSQAGPCDDGDACTTGDACSGGACAGTPVLQCSDGNPCTTDVCDPDTGCTYVDNTAPCDDGDPCTTGDTCSAGACAGGAPLPCDDGDPCTDDACAPGSGCVFANNTAACDDGDVCTAGDSCSGGFCGGAAIVCDDGNPCTDDGCDPGLGCTATPNAAPCDDGEPCTSGDACNGGVCQGGGATPCDDGDACTTDGCTPGVGCTAVDASAACDDGNPCTDDGCDPASGCVATPNGAPCDDGDACTTGDVCAGGACGGTPLFVCDDGNPCTTDTCDPATGCSYAPSSAPCDDLDPCTTGDLCAGGACLPGSPVVCTDLEACTDDACIPFAGCVFVANAAPCDDGDACTTGDVCAGGACGGTPLFVCNDDNPCTTDTCDPASGCTFTANTAPCDDGDACTAPDGCSGGSCVPGGPAACDDGSPCTDDACSPAIGCIYTDNTLPCDDGDACTTGDACAAGLCIGLPVLLCDDDDPCTTDSCDPAVGCVAAPSPAGSPCVTASGEGGSCDVGGACVPDTSGVTAQLTVGVPAPDDAQSAPVGAAVTVPIVIDNLGPDDNPFVNVTITASLPLGSPALEGTPCATATSCAATLTALPAGETTVLLLTFTVTEAATATLTVTLASPASPDPSLHGATATVTGIAPLQLSASVAPAQWPYPAQTGEIVGFLLTVGNPAPFPVEAQIDLSHEAYVVPPADLDSCLTLDLATARCTVTLAAGEERALLYGAFDEVLGTKTLDFAATVLGAPGGEAFVAGPPALAQASFEVATYRSGLLDVHIDGGGFDEALAEGGVIATSIYLKNTGDTPLEGIVVSVQADPIFEVFYDGCFVGDASLACAVSVGAFEGTGITVTLTGPSVSELEKNFDPAVQFDVHLNGLSVGQYTGKVEVAAKCASPADAGKPCADGDYCTVQDTCDGAGNCVGGPPRQCTVDDNNLPATPPCSVGTCNSNFSLGCQYTTLPTGAPCTSSDGKQGTCQLDNSCATTALAVKVGGDQAVPVGTVAQVPISVSNAGPSAATGVTVTVLGTHPESDFSVTLDGAPLVCAGLSCASAQGFSLAAGASVEGTLEVVVTKPQAFAFGVFAESAEQFEESQTVTVRGAFPVAHTLTLAPLELGPVAPGVTATTTGTLAHDPNNVLDLATLVEVTTGFGSVFEIEPDRVSLPVAAAGSVQTFEVSARGFEHGRYGAVVEARPFTDVPILSSPLRQTLHLDVVDPEVDAQIASSVAQLLEVLEGKAEPAAFDLVIGSSGTATAPDVTLELASPPPANVTVTLTTTAGSCTVEPPACSFGDLAPGQSVTVTVEVTGEDPGDFSFDFEVKSGGLPADGVTVDGVVLPQCGAGTEGTPCNDENPCTEDDLCNAQGVCEGAPVGCAADVCHSATCDPATGGCVDALEPDGTPCAGAPGIVGASCVAGACVGGAPAPIALTVTAEGNDSSIDITAVPPFQAQQTQQLVLQAFFVNPGPAVTGAQVVFTLPPGLTAVGFEPTAAASCGLADLSCTLGPLAQGGSGAVRLTVVAAEAGLQSLSVQALAPGVAATQVAGAVNVTAAADTELTTVFVPSGTLAVGQPYELQVLLRNAGATPCATASLSGTFLGPGAGSLSVSGSSVSCAAPPCAALAGIGLTEANELVTVVVAASAPGVYALHLDSGCTALPEAQVGNNLFDTSFTFVADAPPAAVDVALALSPAALPEPVAVGAPVEVQATATLTLGAPTGVNVLGDVELVVSAASPAVTLVGAATPAGACAPGGGALTTCAVGPIAAGQPLTVVVTVAGTAPGSYPLSFQANLKGGLAKLPGGTLAAVPVAEATLANNQASLLLEVLPVCTPGVSDGLACDDGLKCTDNDVCNAQGACAGTPIVCDAPDLCNAAKCDEASGACVSEPANDDAPCGDGGCQICAGGSCIAKECAPSEASKVTECLETQCVAGACVDVTLPDGAGCAEDTGTCSGGACECPQSGDALVNACVETRAVGGICQDVPLVGTPCDDGNPCTTNDSCGVIKDVPGSCGGTLVTPCEQAADLRIEAPLEDLARQLLLEDPAELAVTVHNDGPALAVTLVFQHAGFDEEPGNVSNSGELVACVIDEAALKALCGLGDLEPGESTEVSVHNGLFVWELEVGSDVPDLAEADNFLVVSRGVSVTGGSNDEVPGGVGGVVELDLASDEGLAATALWIDAGGATREIGAVWHVDGAGVQTELPLTPREGGVAVSLGGLLGEAGQVVVELAPCTGESDAPVSVGVAGELSGSAGAPREVSLGSAVVPVRTLACPAVVDLVVVKPAADAVAAITTGEGGLVTLFEADVEVDDALPAGTALTGFGFELSAKIGGTEPVDDPDPFAVAFGDKIQVLLQKLASQGGAVAGSTSATVGSTPPPGGKAPKTALFPQPVPVPKPGQTFVGKATVQQGAAAALLGGAGTAGLLQFVVPAAPPLDPPGPPGWPLALLAVALVGAALRVARRRPGLRRLLVALAFAAGGLSCSDGQAPATGEAEPVVVQVRVVELYFEDASGQTIVVPADVPGPEITISEE